MANRYRVKGELIFDLDDIIADDEEDAFIQASDAAMHGGGDWYYDVELIEEDAEE